MTITEQILAKHSDKIKVEPGDNIWIDVDILMTHDVCGPPVIGIFKKQFGKYAKVWDSSKVVIIPDHYIFTSDPYAIRNIEILREFVVEQNIPHYYDVGTDHYKGVCHVALPEEGLTLPGEVMFGTDSHTCTAGAFGEFATGIGNTDAAFILGTGKLWVKVPETMKFIFDDEIPPFVMAKDIILKIIGDIGVDGASYKCMEFAGAGIHFMDMESRMTLTNMVIEAGGKNGIIEPDEVTFSYLKNRTSSDFEPVFNNGNSNYFCIKNYNSKELEPMVAKPHSPANVVAARELRDVSIDRAYIGSCTGGKLTDLYAAAKILKNKKVTIDTFVVPATTEVSSGLKSTKIDNQTLWEVFERSGAQIGEASCAACLGGPADTFGRLNQAEVCISVVLCPPDERNENG